MIATTREEITKCELTQCGSLFFIINLEVCAFLDIC